MLDLQRYTHAKYLLESLRYVLEDLLIKELNLKTNAQFYTNIQQFLEPLLEEKTMLLAKICTLKLLITDYEQNNICTHPKEDNAK